MSMSLLILGIVCIVGGLLTLRATSTIHTGLRIVLTGLGFVGAMVGAAIISLFLLRDRSSASLGGPLSDLLMASERCREISLVVKPIGVPSPVEGSTVVVDPKELAEARRLLRDAFVTAPNHPISLWEANLEFRSEGPALVAAMAYTRSGQTLLYFFRGGGTSGWISAKLSCPGFGEWAQRRLQAGSAARSVERP